MTKEKEIVLERTLAICTILDENKADDIVCYDIEKISDSSLYAVIATGHSLTHMRGLLRTIDIELSEDPTLQILGTSLQSKETGWIVFDCGDTVFHLMLQERRDFYELDRLWNKPSSLYQKKN